jgi:folate-binding Fe-S cluster repair protein YgfZ
MHFKRLAHNLNRSWIYLNKSSYHTQDLTNYRTLINVKGADSAKYLQNLITNDINLLQNESIISIYSHILNNRGRTLYDTIVYKNKFDQSGEPSYLIEIDSQFINEAIKLLSLFKIKKKVDIKVMDDKFKLYSVFNDESNKILQINEIEKDLKCKEFLLAQDPRTSFLGFRLIVNNETIGKKNTNLIFFIIF